MIQMYREAPGAYRVVVTEIDCLVAIRDEADSSWLRCADVVVRNMWAVPLAAMIYASVFATCRMREAASSARGSRIDS